ncbi:hypothetical protein ACPV3S_19925 [Photobacterium damselae]|uniref:hypothetical protein n=1 Tax=Photobacterium damselae TaxID=38293 RepID=UPI0040682289
MSKILFVCNFIYNQNKVSSFRTTFFVEKLRESFDVDILSSGELDNLVGSHMTLSDARTSNTISFLENFFKYRTALQELCDNYEKIIISVPRFSLLYFIVFSLNKNYKGSIILDLRDQLNLQEFNRQSRSKILRPFVFLLNILDRKLFTQALKKCSYVICVGKASKEYFLDKYDFFDKKRVINIHNGFNIDDLDIIKNIGLIYTNQEHNIKSLLIGNISGFRLSKKLFSDFSLLSEKAIIDNITLTIEHYGKIDKRLENYINKLPNIVYNNQGYAERKELIKNLDNYDLHILITSISLEWEPTTTVFDYILSSRPVLLLGGKDNEAVNILNDVEHLYIISSHDYSLAELAATKNNKLNLEKIKKYTREHQVKKLLSLINEIY